MVCPSLPQSKMKKITIISLGAGVQSSAMALMAAKGEITPAVDFCIFADTNAEPDDVYDWLDFLEDELPFPVYRVMHKEGLTKALEDGVKEKIRFASPPLFTHDPATGGAGILNRQCTLDYKIAPIKKKIREMLGLKPRQRAKDVHCTQYIGISLDELNRAKASLVPYIDHRFPLIEKRIKRGDCIEWMKRNGYPEPPRSACTYCPYHSDHEWKKLKEHDQNGWDEAVRIDELLRHGNGKTKSKLYVHQSLMPLPQVDLSTDVDRGQLVFGWDDMCDGHCGV